MTESKESIHTRPWFTCAAAALLAAAVVTSGCSGNGEAHAQGRKGAEATAWGLPYANMPDIVPPGVRQDAYTPLTAEQQAGLAVIDPAKGYRTDNLGGGVYMVSDSLYNAMFVVSNAGVILVDAPPLLMGDKILKAIQEVAPGQKVVAFIYTHSHVDHVGFAGEVLKAFPGIPIYAHEETKKILVRANDPRRPVPTVTFDTVDVDFPLVVGDQTLLLSYPGGSHQPGNIAIYHPGQKVLMLVDVAHPGWMMFRRLSLATDVPGYYALMARMNARWDFETLIAGHFRKGTRADVTTQLEFMTDLYNAAGKALGKTPLFDGRLNADDVKNGWVIARDFVDRVTNECVNEVTPKWSSRLAGFDVWIYEQCSAVEQSIRVDGLSIP